MYTSCEVCGEPAVRRFMGVESCYACMVKTCKMNRHWLEQARTSGSQSEN